MLEHNFARIEVPKPLRLRLKGALRALRGKDVLFDAGARIERDGKRFTLAKMTLAQWVETDDPDEAQQTFALIVERGVGQIEWDGLPEAAQRSESCG